MASTAPRLKQWRGLVTGTTRSPAPTAEVWCLAHSIPGYVNWETRRSLSDARTVPLLAPPTASGEKAHSRPGAGRAVDPLLADAYGDVLGPSAVGRPDAVGDNSGSLEAAIRPGIDRNGRAHVNESLSEDGRVDGRDAAWWAMGSGVRSSATWPAEGHGLSWVRTSSAQPGRSKNGLRLPWRSEIAAFRCSLPEGHRFLLVPGQ